MQINLTKQVLNPKHDHSILVQTQKAFNRIVRHFVGRLAACQSPRMHAAGLENQQMHASNEWMVVSDECMLVSGQWMLVSENWILVRACWGGLRKPACAHWTLVSDSEPQWMLLDACERKVDGTDACEDPGAVVRHSENILHVNHDILQVYGLIQYHSL